MTTAEMTIEQFLAALAARQTMPGGGAAAAVTGAQAAGLVSMVINFTLGNPKFAAVEEAMQGYLTQSEALRGEILSLADADIEAFNAVAAGYKLPRGTAEEKAARTAAIQQALKGATEVPFQLAERCLALAKLIEPVGAQGNPNVVSDAAAALYLVEAAFQAALVNVNINLKVIKDEAFVAAASEHRDVLQAEFQQRRVAAQSACEQSLGVSL
jgi:formiminotetrahydrofolate cyclodeaminase